jgi:hypothetical protein
MQRAVSGAVQAVFDAGFGGRAFALAIAIELDQLGAAGGTDFDAAAAALLVFERA